MARPTLRLLLLLATALVACTLGAGPAAAAFDVVPSGCHVSVSPEENWNLFSTSNPNSAAATVAYGPDNIVLQAPNFRTGQPTVFPPGYSEGIFSVPYNPLEQPEIDWVLQGAETGNGAECSGSDAPQDATAPSVAGTPVSGGTVTLSPGTWTGTTGAGSIHRVATVFACDASGCVPAAAGSLPQFDDGAAWPLQYTVGPGLAGKRLRLVVTAFTTRGATMASSALTAPVDGSADTPSAIAAGPSPAYGTAVVWMGDAAWLRNDTQHWSGVPMPAVTYQWQRCSSSGCADISGATGTSYKPVPGDIGDDVQLTAHADNGSSTLDWTSNALHVDAVPHSQDAPYPLALPGLAGSAGEGLPLSADTGVFNNDSQPTVTWQRCDSTGACAGIAGADGAAYTPTAADVGSRLRAVVIATNPDAARSDIAVPESFRAATELSDVVTAAPVNTSAPLISGSGDVGTPLHVDSVGTWSPAAATTTIHWERCSPGCSVIAGADGATYTPTAADAGSTIRALVTAVASVGASQAESNPSPVVGSVRLATAPSTGGTAAVGSDLLATAGDWIGTPAPDLALQWLRCDQVGGTCSAISGATGYLYRPAADDAGHTLRVRVRAWNAFSEADATSLATAPIAAGVAAPGQLVADHTSPQLTRVRFTPVKFAVARGATAVAARARGSRLRFTTSESGYLRIDLVRAGRRGTAGTLTRVVHAGTHAIAFSGRIGRTRLAPGHYVASVVIFDSAGNRSHARRAPFTILRG